MKGMFQKSARTEGRGQSFPASLWPKGRHQGIVGYIENETKYNEYTPKELSLSDHLSPVPSLKHAKIKGNINILVGIKKTSFPDLGKEASPL